MPEIKGLGKVPMRLFGGLAFLRVSFVNGYPAKSDKRGAQKIDGNKHEDFIN